MQRQGEKISIIIPAYIDTEEKQHWLQEAIQSAQKQSYKNKEIIVVDDYSPIPVQYGQAIRLNENVGTAVARNTAAYYATGELLLPLDYDDKLMPDAAELLYNNYEPNHFIYGNVTLFGNVKSEVTTSFPQFDCYNVLNLSGVIPVTALHSKENHIQAGGWKGILKDGLEDVEYWISMVRQCVLGIRINEPILYYRKHHTSRTEQLRSGDKEGKTKAIIRKIHEDLFSGGNMPCAGCGASKRHQTQSIKPKEIVSTNLQDYPESLLMTIQYNGPRSGSFGIVGPKTGVSYRIQGTGTQLKIHKDDWGRFKDLDAGKAFVIVTAAMQQPKTIEPTEYKPNQPEIAEARKPQFDLSELDMSKDVTILLAENGWTVEKIATEAVVGDLKDIKGIGPKTELRLMERAKALYYK